MEKDLRPKKWVLSIFDMFFLFEFCDHVFSVNFVGIKSTLHLKKSTYFHKRF